MSAPETSESPPVQRLLDRGVRMPCPASVWIDEEVRSDHIAPGVEIHGGCRISGSDTSIGPGSILGSEGPVTLRNSQLGHGVRVAGGSVTEATLLDEASLGPCAHIRAGTLLEEQSSGAHSVGLKQTILMPFVTLGSLINFCDSLMAGGTSRREHSEVGSSYVHFNFTPHGDKATASLIGDVPLGVLLNEPPIFLGGQGGLVGPCRIAYGTVIAAGTVCRQDVLVRGCLVPPSAEPRGERRPYTMGLYRGSRRRLSRELTYFGNILALRQWYRDARRGFMSADPFRERCRAGALTRLELVLEEREARLDQWVKKLPRSLACMDETGFAPTHPEYVAQKELLQVWPGIHDRLTALRESGDLIAHAPGDLVEALSGGAPSDSWPLRVQALSPDRKERASAWLQGIVDTVQGLWQATA